MALSPHALPTVGCKDCSSLADSLMRTMLEMRVLLTTLTPDDYIARSTELFANSSIGGHVRHCLDHARAVVDARESGVVDYDHRARGTCIETDIAAAEAELCRLIAGIERLAMLDANEPVNVSVMPCRDGGSITLLSTFGREFAFVLSHTIHHNATIRGIAVSLGRPVPASFGCAPSTLAHLDSLEGNRCPK